MKTRLVALVALAVASTLGLVGCSTQARAERKGKRPAIKYAKRRTPTMTTKRSDTFVGPTTSLPTSPASPAATFMRTSATSTATSTKCRGGTPPTRT